MYTGDRLHQGREDKLAKGAAGVDEAGSGCPAFDRQALGGRADQDGEAAPAPAALITPRVMSKPHCESMNGVSAVPTARRIAPTTITLPGPCLSAIAPKMACDAPHMNCATAIAKLIDTMPSPVEVLIGETKSRWSSARPS